MKRLSILLVEDNPDDVELIREAFISIHKHIELILATSIADAIARLKTIPTSDQLDLVILDHHLSDGGGQELIKHVRSCPRHSCLQMVMISGDLMQPDGLGDTPWFNKPDTWPRWKELASLLLKRITTAE